MLPRNLLSNLPVVNRLVPLVSRKKHFVNVKPAVSPSSPPLRPNHVPVLLNEVVENLAPALNDNPEPVVIDMTFGCGGHSRAILERWPRARLICLDRDPHAFRRCEEFASSFDSPKIAPLLGRFRDLPELLESNDNKKNLIGNDLFKADAVLFDLGVSSPQFDDASRGFSLANDGPLDMRMDADRQSDVPTAADVLNQLPVADLAKIIRIYGEERHADEVARAIVDYRNSRGPITKTAQLAAVIQAASGQRDSSRDKLGRYAHPATRTFQALRIFVNDELNDLCHGLDVAHDLLRPSGRCLVISFHSLEDRIVKRIFHSVSIRSPEGVDESQVHSRLRSSVEPLTAAQMASLLSRKWKPLSSKIAWKGAGQHHVIVPCQAEVDANPRARSAKLRVAEKI